MFMELQEGDVEETFYAITKLSAKWKETVTTDTAVSQIHVNHYDSYHLNDIRMMYDPTMVDPYVNKGNTILY